MAAYYRVLIPLPRNPLILGPLLSAYAPKIRGGWQPGRPNRYIKAIQPDKSDRPDAHIWPGLFHGRVD